MKTTRIWIFGGTASGKTTLAENISKKLNLPCHSTDKFVYKGDFNSKYTEKQRNKKLEKFSSRKSWIIEGVHQGEWILPAFKKANLVILLKPRRLIQIKRIISRYFQRKSSKKEWAGTIKDNLILIKYAWIYKTDYFVHHQRFVKEYNKRFIILKNDKETANFVKKLK